MDKKLKIIAGYYKTVRADCYKDDSFLQDKALIRTPCEQNLTIEEQIFEAKHIVKLVNSGWKVVVFTNSDYIIREFNNMIMLKKYDFEGKAQFQKKNIFHEKYHLLDPDIIEAYYYNKKQEFKNIPMNEYGLNFKEIDFLINETNERADFMWNIVDELFGEKDDTTN